jgi:hypothetical protein
MRTFSLIGLIVANIMVVFTSAAIAQPSSREALASGPIFHGRQNVAVCYINNVSATDIHLFDLAIFDESGGRANANINTCKSQIKANTMCAYSAPIPNVLAHYCAIVVGTGDATKLRANFDIRSGSETLLSTQIPIVSIPIQ